MNENIKTWPEKYRLPKLFVMAGASNNRPAVIVDVDGKELFEIHRHHFKSTADLLGFRDTLVTVCNHSDLAADQIKAAQLAAIRAALDFAYGWHVSRRLSFWDIDPQEILEQLNTTAANGS